MDMTKQIGGYGSKYDKDMSLKEVAKGVREDIKAAKAAALLPKEVKVSVRTEYFSMGCALQLNVVKVPEGTSLRGALEFAKVVTRIAEQYHRNNSDPQTDYFDVNFYGERCEVDYQLRDQLADDRPQCEDCGSLNVPRIPDDADPADYALRCPMHESQERDRLQRAGGICRAVAAMAKLPADLDDASIRFSLLELDLPANDSEPEPEGGMDCSAHAAFLAAVGVE